ncbi:MAG: AAA family ATPase [Simkaniaceae bacterium]|nr:AAA family ATPase [Simkaniaceae bacterium]
MKKLPIGLQNIQEILEEGHIYVDKTGFARDLIANGKHYFLSRPRRFGKSLFLNTLEEIFKGNKELFKDCQIYDSDFDWQDHPVLHFDFAKVLSTTSKDFKKGLEDAIDDVSKLHEILIEGSSYLSRLNRLIIRLSEKNRVVVLVDEYDSAIINNRKDPELAEKNRDLLKAFFGTLKSLDKYLKFTFVTGVSKFSQVSLFSGPNNLKDITMDPRYAGMMGYTEEELKHSFKDYIQLISKQRSERETTVTEEAILDEVRTWYNGYRFQKENSAFITPFQHLISWMKKKLKVISIALELLHFLLMKLTSTQDLLSR